MNLSDAQAQAIVDMRLRALTGLEREKLENEHAELVKTNWRIKGNFRQMRNILLGVIKDRNCRPLPINTAMTEEVKLVMMN